MRLRALCDHRMFYFFRLQRRLKDRSTAAKDERKAKKTVGSMETTKKIMGNSHCVNKSRKRLTQKETKNPISYQ